VTAQLSVLAAEVNVVWNRRLWPRGIQNDDLTEADRRALEHDAAVEERLPQETVSVDLDETTDECDPQARQPAGQMA
jgi:hypothetical protein